MANSLPGSPIVGFFNETTGDFEEHNRIIDVSNGKFQIKDTTRPYGFVDLNAKVWFQKFLDDGIEHEYLMTEGYLWTGQYPECERVITNGNNQSMELDKKTLNAFWSHDNNGKPEFFIINEAIISKLCILGENVEPCFEGATITEFSLSFENEFKEQLFSLIEEMKEILNKGGSPVFTKYSVEIGDSLWNAIYEYMRASFSDGEGWTVYSIDGIFEDNGQKFAVLKNRKDMKYYRMNFSLSEDNGFVPTEGLIEVTKNYTEVVTEPQFPAEAVAEFEQTYSAAPVEEVIEEVPAVEPVEENPVEPEPEVTYNLDDIPEYGDLLSRYNALETANADLQTTINTLQEEIEQLKTTNSSLAQFKQSIEKEQKQKMIDSFYMLSDEDKQDVTANIDTYSIEDIEAKLAVICVRNKVSFNLEGEPEPAGSTTYNLDSVYEDNSVPAWIKAALETQKSL